MQCALLTFLHVVAVGGQAQIQRGAAALHRHILQDMRASCIAAAALSLRSIQRVQQSRALLRMQTTSRQDRTQS